MIERLFATIRQVGVFIVCARMILHFKPAESYGKYMKLLVSMLVLVQLLAPVMEIFGGEGRRTLRESVLFYEKELADTMDNIKITSVTAEEVLETLTMEEIKTRLNNRKTQDAEEKEEVETGEEIKGKEGKKFEEGAGETKEQERGIEIKKIEVAGDA